MNTLSFAFADSPRSGDHQVRPLVDGADLLERVAGDWLGLDPPDFFRQSQLLSGGRLFIGRCGECGILNCDWVAARVVRNVESVTWQLDDERKFEFSPAEYFRTVESAAKNNDWEPVERTAARLVSSLDFTTLQEQGFTFEWASASHRPGRVSLSFWTADRPHQRLFHIEWDGHHPEDAVEQVKHWLNQNPAASLRTPPCIGRPFAARLAAMLPRRMPGVVAVLPATTATFLSHAAIPLHRPTHRLRLLLADPQRVARASAALLALGVLYTFTVIVGYRQGFGAVVPPVLPIPARDYYFWEAFFAIPVLFLGALLFAGTCRWLSRLLGGRGSFQDTFACFGFASLVPVLLTMWLPETALMALFPGQRASDLGGFAILPAWADAARQIAGTAWTVAITAVGVRLLEGSSWPRSAAATVLAAVLYTAFLLLFIR